MKKLFLGAVLAAGLMSSVVAQGLFVGAEADYVSKFPEPKTNINAIGSSTTSDGGGSAGGGIKVGYDFDLWQLYGAYIYYIGGNLSYAGGGGSLTLDNDASDLLIGANWTPQINDKFKAIAGIFVGHSTLNTDISFAGGGQALTQSVSQSGFIYGAKFGANLQFGLHNEIEFGLKYDNVKYSDKESIALSPTVSIDLKDTKRSGVGIFVGYNYKF